MSKELYIICHWFWYRGDRLCKIRGISLNIGQKKSYLCVFNFLFWMIYYQKIIIFNGKNVLNISRCEIKLSGFFDLVFWQVSQSTPTAMKIRYGLQGEVPIWFSGIASVCWKGLPTNPINMLLIRIWLFVGLFCLLFYFYFYYLQERFPGYL